MTENTLPEFGKPPITEVAFGVLFKPLPHFSVAHFGRLWERYRTEYPKTETHPPLAHVVEELGPVRFPTQQVQPSGGLEPQRVWFIHEKQNSLIQVQHDRFLYNWRKLKEDDEYPRYEKVFGSFKECFATFRRFLDDERIGGVEPEQYELTYVNHIPQGAGWDDISQIGDALPVLCPRVFSVASGEIESLNLRAVFRLREDRGRLYATIRHALRLLDNVPTLYLELSARLSKVVSLDLIEDQFAIAHEAILNRFVELTDKGLQKDVWRRTN